MTGAAARRRRDPTAAFVVAGIAAVLLAVTLLGAITGGGSEPAAEAPPSADGWVTAAEEAFAPFQQLPEAWRTLDEWRRGSASASDAVEQLAQLDEALATVEPALAAIGPHPDVALAAPLHVATAQLYDITIDVERVAVSMPPGAGANEVDLIGRRLAVLANRVFDRGRAAVGEGPAADLGPDVVVHRPDPVPSWAEEGLAAAATQAPAPTAGPIADWVEAVRSTVPDLGVLDELLVTGDVDALVAFADRLEAATMALRALAADADREGSTRVLLGFLLRVEAARLAATGDPPLQDAAAEVAAIASSAALWHPALGPLP